MWTKAFMVNMYAKPIKHLPGVVRTRALHSRHQHLSMGPNLFLKSVRYERSTLSHSPHTLAYFELFMAFLDSGQAGYPVEHGEGWEV